jgi:cell division septal protein FtsQ
VRDQVGGQRVGNRSGISGKNRAATTAQRPVRRGRDSAVTLSGGLRQILNYVPAALKIGLVLTIAVLVFLGYRAAASASFFQVKHIQTRGVSRASDESIIATVRRDVSSTGVWRADLHALSTHLEQLPWVRTAIVTRVLPDGIRVRITEREPKVVVRTSAGRFLWVDEDAVVLSEMVPSDQMPTFFLRGWNEEEATAVRVENKERILKFLQLQNDWDALGLSERVSEVNLLDVGDVRAQLAGDDSQIEIRLGAQDLGQRLKKALTVLDSQRQTNRGPLISYIDMTQGRHAIVGLVSGSKVTETTEANEPSPTAEQVSAADRARPRRSPERSPDRNSKDAKRNQVKKPDQKRT